MGGNAKFDPETEKLVQEVKTEMERDGSRYTPPTNDKRYKHYSRHGKKIKPEFGMLLSKMINNKPETVSLPKGIQFRGTPRRKSVE